VISLSPGKHEGNRHKISEIVYRPVRRKIPDAVPWPLSPSLQQCNCATVQRLLRGPVALRLWRRNMSDVVPGWHEATAAALPTAASKKSVLLTESVGIMASTSMNNRLCSYLPLLYLPLRQ
jgi:hypothetical protein